MNCWLVLTGIDEAAGDMVMDCKLTAAAVTESVADACTVPDCAPIVTVPAADPLANPPPLIDATLVSDELHVTELLMSFVVPSERWAVATNCCVLPIPIAMDAGETTSDETVGVVLDEPDEPDVPEDCDLLPEEAPPPQPQLSDARIKTAMPKTFFMTFSRYRPAMPEHPGRNLVRSRRRLALEASPPRLSPSQG